jgi:hypothetical protein
LLKWNDNKRKIEMPHYAVAAAAGLRPDIIAARAETESLFGKGEG